MKLAAFLLLVCAQEGQRSGPERAALVRAEARGSLARTGRTERAPRASAGPARDVPRGFGFLEGLELAPVPSPSVVELGARPFSPGLDASLRSPADVRAALFGYV